MQDIAAVRTVGTRQSGQVRYGSEQVERATQAMASSNALTVGAKINSLWMTPDQFFPVGDPRECALINDGSFVYRSAGPCTAYVANLPLPEGALVTGYTLFGEDSDPNAELTLGLQSPAFVMGHFDNIISPSAPYAVVKSGVAATFTGPQQFSGAANVTIDHFQWQGGIDYAYAYSYPLVAISVPVSQNLGVFAVQVGWRKQYGPSPASSTFNDVSTSHPYYTEIEMLAAAGISNGCGSGRFCPDAMVTRGQMAVFLSRALGLYDAMANDAP